MTLRPRQRYSSYTQTEDKTETRLGWTGHRKESHLKRNQKLEGKMTNAEVPMIQYTGHKIDRLDHNYHHKSKRRHREYIKVKTLGQ